MIKQIDEKMSKQVQNLHIDRQIDKHYKQTSIQTHRKLDRCRDRDEIKKMLMMRVKS